MAGKASGDAVSSERRKRFLDPFHTLRNFFRLKAKASGDVVFSDEAAQARAPLRQGEGFLDLPAEIRNQIYEYAVPKSIDWKRKEKLEYKCGLWIANKQTHQEIRGLILENTTFVMHSPTISFLNAEFNESGAERLRKLHITIHIDAKMYQPWSSGDWRMAEDTLKKLIRFRGLRTLTVELHHWKYKVVRSIKGFGSPLPDKKSMSPLHEYQFIDPDEASQYHETLLESTGLDSVVIKWTDHCGHEHDWPPYTHRSRSRTEGIIAVAKHKEIKILEFLVGAWGP
ncbi:hypothetical protein NA57DRAFT_73548 [Rhizodiscina lignyota]|uniref:Uncharacterized protein n=1 Tax=Rhizodiscina lignyota TaxID=1504668 RepID=A0A9P4ILU0_9PEZI|nr:hypothetical protein NA57DRAFT_73548 [Rhizodiscina lignyota]